LGYDNIPYGLEIDAKRKTHPGIGFWASETITIVGCYHKNKHLN